MFLVFGHHFPFLALPHGVRDHRGLFFLEEDLLQAITQRSVLVWGAAAWNSALALLQPALHSIVYSLEPWVFAPSFLLICLRVLFVLCLSGSLT